MFLSTRLRRGASLQSVAACTPDERADGGIRHIHLSPRGVRIQRQVAGVKMHVAVPIQSYRGLMLSRDETTGHRLYKIALVHGDPALTVELGAAFEAPAILAIWRSWAVFFGKPALYREAARLLPREPGETACARPHRRGNALAKRRPRFLKRRGSAPIGLAFPPRCDRFVGD